MVARHKSRKVQAPHIIGVQKALLTMYKLKDPKIPIQILRSQFTTLAEVTYFRTQEIAK